MKYPKINETERVRLLAPPAGRTEVVLDADTYNEIDDQFALSHALLLPDQRSVRAAHAPASSQVEFGENTVGVHTGMQAGITNSPTP